MTLDNNVHLYAFIQIVNLLPTFSAPLFDMVYSTGQNNIPSVVFSGTPIFELYIP